MSDEPNPKIQLKITFEGRSVNFSTKREKPLVKVFNAFSERLNIDNNALRFFLNEVRLRPEQTPAELDMEDGEEIDATLMQAAVHPAPQFSALNYESNILVPINAEHVRNKEKATSQHFFEGSIYFFGAIGCTAIHDSDSGIIMDSS